MDDMEIVSAVRAALIDKVGSERFDLWFGDRVQLLLDGERLRVIAPDPFILDRLRRTMRKEVLEACREVVGSTLEVDYQLASDLSLTERAPVTEDLTPTAPRQGQRRGSSGDLADERSLLAGTAKKSMKSQLLRSTTARPAARAPASDRLPTGRSATPAVRGPAATGLRVVAAAPAEAAVPGPRPARDWQSLVVGDANRVAVAAAQRVAAQPGSSSPLFLHGPHGCGKTHLLEALADSVRRSRKLKRVVSLTAEQFTSQFLEALQGSGLPSFRRKYRDVDLLVIDDLQFFLGKKHTIVEFQYTLDALRRQGKQVVLAADRPPAELHGLGHELIARLSEGTSCPLEVPDVAMRRAIITQFARRQQVSLPAEVVKMLSEQLSGDTRFILGAINRLQATSEALEQPITGEFALQVLSDLFRVTRRVVRLADIERAVCDVFGIETQSLQSERKIRTVSQPRMLAMWLARKHTRAALSEIGSYFGLRSHTSVISAQRRVERLLSTREANQVQRLECSFSEAVRRVELQLKTGS